MGAPPQQPHKVVILGAGAGGLELAVRLGRRYGPEHVLLVDKSGDHIWKPSLHEVAAGTLDIHREGLSYFMLARDRNFTFILGEVLHVDREQKQLYLERVFTDDHQEIFPERTLSYDTLVLAVGSKSNFFGTPGASEYAVALDSTIEAERFRLKFLHQLVTLNRRKVDNPDAVVNIGIVGGGATGVELAAELLEASRGLVPYGLANVDPEKDVKITLLEGADRLLSALPERTSAAAQQLLLDRGVDVKTSVRVDSVAEDALFDSEGRRYPADLCVWAAGIQAPAFLGALGLATNRINQVIVDAGLRTEDPNVYAFGDCAQAPSYEDPAQFLPARAQVAHQQAKFLQGIMASRIHGRDPGHQRFRFRDYGSLVSVGHNRGVGTLMGVLSGRSLFVEGLIARLMYMSLHLMHHMTVLGPLRTGSLALGRLLTKRGAPRVKLH
jgi:NADH dehydrogenase